MEWFIYLLKVSACMALFSGFYLLFLKKLTFFKVNRFYLCITLLLSVTIPLFQIHVSKRVEHTAAIAMPEVVKKDRPLQTVQPSTAITSAAAPDQERVSGYMIAVYVYAAVALILILLSIWRSFQILKHTRCPVRRVNGLKLISKSTGFTNCSFFNYVFVDETALSHTELELFLKHEEVHVKQYHSIDKIGMLLAKAIMWANPFIYLYDKELTQTHEFEADAITSQRFGKEPYARMILSMAIAMPGMPLAHHFVKSPVKERIKMLFTPKSSNMKKGTYALAFPICIGLIGLFGIQFVAAQQTPRPEKAPKKITEVTTSKEKIKPAQRKDPTGPIHTIGKAGSENYTIVADSVFIEQVNSEHVALGNAVVGGTVNINWKNAPKDTVHKAVWHLGATGGYPVETDKAVWRLTSANDGAVSMEENPGCRISKIENDKKFTIISFEYTASHANDWALLNKEIYIQANNNMKHFQYVKSEGIPLAPHRHNFTQPGEKLTFKVYFEKIPLTAKSIDVVERAGRSDFFNFYGVPLPASYFAQN